MITISTGETFKLDVPIGEELPQKVHWYYIYVNKTFCKGFDPGQDTYQAPPDDGEDLRVDVDPNRYLGFILGSVVFCNIQ